VLQAEDHLEFAQAEYYLLARQLQEALQEEHEEEEEEEEEQQEEEEEDVANDVVIPIPGQVLHRHRPEGVPRWRGGTCDVRQ